LLPFLAGYEEYVQNVTSSTFTLSAPVVSAGQVLIAVLFSDAASSTPYWSNETSGWTKLKDVGNAANKMAGVWTKVSDGTETQFQVTGSTSNQAVGYFIAIGNASSVDDVNDTLHASSTSYNLSDVPVNRTLALAITGSDDESASMTIDNSFVKDSEIANVASGISAVLATRTFPEASGNTGATTVTSDVIDTAISFMIGVS
jgi:hypothetical protein